MVTSVYSNTTALEFKDNSLRSRLPLKNDELDEIRIELTQALQTTLDINKLIEIFFTRLQQAVMVKSIHYCSSDKTVDCLQGRESAHRCEYRLRTQDDDLGEVVFSRNKRFSENDMAQLETLMGTLHYPLRNALQFHQVKLAALSDSLTGLGNRAAMDIALHHELHMSKRHNYPLSLLLIDIDFFKQVNDQFGHSNGDKVLQHIAKGLTETSRETDRVFRYGGEEFVVLLSNTDIEGARVTAERIRSHIESMTMQIQQQSLSITTSIGVGSLVPDETIHALFERTDIALYRAKDLGRNRVEIAVIDQPSASLQA